MLAVFFSNRDELRRFLTTNSTSISFVTAARPIESQQKEDKNDYKVHVHQLEMKQQNEEEK